jgi:serine phosphatase RsbU (regulator of sigma subunit)
VAPSTLFSLAAAALGVLLFLWRSRVEARGPETPLALGGAGFAALVLAERAAAALPHASPTAAALRLVAALGALAVWTGLAALAFHRARRRDLFWIVPFGLFTTLVLRGDGPSTGLALVLSLPVVARWRWMDRTGRRATGFALAAAFLLPTLAFVPVPGDPAANTAAGAALVRFGAWARELAGLYLLFALPGLLTRWSIGVRRVSRRLTLLLMLSGLIPLLLMGILWGSTTVLGVSGERALLASRLVEDAGAHLHAALLRERGAGDAGLDALARAHPRWDGLRLWRSGVRVHGDSVRDERALAAWPDTSMQHGLVVLGDTAWIGARVRDDAGGALVALLPSGTLARTELDHQLGARTFLTASAGDSAAESLADSVEAAVGSVSDPVRRIEENRRRNPSAVRFSVGQETPTLADTSLRLGAGHAIVHGMGWNGRRWQRTGGLLSVEVSWIETLAGLYRNTRENPLSIVSIVMIALVLLLIIMIAGADFGMVRALGSSITAAITALRHGAERLEAGELSHRIEVAGEDDLWDVAAAFNRMAVGLERGRQLEIERQRLEDELALARRIQARLFPAGPPRTAGVELAGRSEPAREVGGDYYDFIALAPDRVALVIADVSGKGVGAALLMSAFRASLLSQDLEGGDLATVAGRLNAFLHRSVEPGKFVTAFFAVLDGASGRLRYCNAGHNAPIVVGTDGEVRRLEEGGLILGILPESRYETGETVLAPGERLVLFTDGVTEAANEQDEQWEEERFVALLRSCSGAPCEDVVGRVVAAVRRFEGGRGASDDVTLIVARRRAERSPTG